MKLAILIPSTSNNQSWKKYQENHTQFIRPSGEEICTNCKTIENGCYW